MVSKTRKKASKKAATKKAGTKKAARKSFTTAAQRSAIKAATKTTKKTAKKAAKKGGDGGVSHSPIIITDGSASIEFAEDEYPQVSATTHQSNQLRLTEIRSNKKHNNDSRICHTLSDGETVEIVFTCKVGGADPKTFIIRGGNFVNGSGSPSIAFDHATFDQPMPPMGSGMRVRRGKGNREITSLEIFQVTGSGSTLVHDCDVIAKKNFRISVKDPHVH